MNTDKMYQCQFCDKAFKHASGLSRHRTVIHAQERDITKSVKSVMSDKSKSKFNEPTASSDTSSSYLSGLIFHAVTSSNIMTTSVYNLVPLTYSFGTNNADAINIQKLLLDSPLSEEVITHGFIFISVISNEKTQENSHKHTLRYRVPLNILNILGCIDHARQHIEFPQCLCPDDIIKVGGVTVKVELYYDSEPVDIQGEMLIKLTMCANTKTRAVVQEKGYRLRHFEEVRSGVYRLDGLVGGFIYKTGTLNHLRLKLNGTIRLDYNRTILDSVSEKLPDGQHCYLSINCVKFLPGFDDNTLLGHRIDGISLEIDNTSDQPVYLDTMTPVKISKHDHYYPNYAGVSLQAESVPSSTEASYCRMPAAPTLQAETVNIPGMGQYVYHCDFCYMSCDYRLMPNETHLRCRYCSHITDQLYYINTGYTQPSNKNKGTIAVFCMDVEDKLAYSVPVRLSNGAVTLMSTDRSLTDINTSLRRNNASLVLHQNGYKYSGTAEGTVKLVDISYGSSVTYPQLPAAKDSFITVTLDQALVDLTTVTSIYDEVPVQ